MAVGNDRLGRHLQAEPRANERSENTSFLSRPTIRLLLVRAVHFLLLPQPHRAHHTVAYSRIEQLKSVSISLDNHKQNFLPPWK